MMVQGLRSNVMLWSWARGGGKLLGLEKKFVLCYECLHGWGKVNRSLILG